MQNRNIALAVLSTTIGVTLLQSAIDWSSLLSCSKPATVVVPADALEARVDRVVATEDGPVVLLEVTDGRYLPIWIGYAEGRAIQRALDETEMPRPMTHDLFASTLSGLDTTIAHVRVDRLRNDGVFIGTIVLVRGEEVVTIDARPSDAMALALRTNRPIFVDEGLGPHMLSPSGE